MERVLERSLCYDMEATESREPETSIRNHSSQAQH